MDDATTGLDGGLAGELDMRSAQRPASSCSPGRAMPRLSGRSRRGCFPFLPRCLAAVPRREAPVPDASPGAGRGGAGRHGALAGRVPRASALVFCASLAAALLGAGGSAEAQEVLVSSYTSATTSDVRFTDDDGLLLFTTGTNAAGYTLTSITFEFYPQMQPSPVPTVKLHNVTVAGGSVTLGTAVATLTTTATTVPNGAAGVTYTLPTDTSLDASTPYGVFVEGGAKQLNWPRAGSTFTAPTPAPGWSLEQLATRAHGATGALTLGSDGPGQITVNGTVKTSTNTAATGAPTITGTATVGETLTAVTTAIMDDDGLTNVSYTYQWIRVATDSTAPTSAGDGEHLPLVTTPRDDQGEGERSATPATPDAHHVRPRWSRRRHHPAPADQRPCHSRRTYIVLGSQRICSSRTRPLTPPSRSRPTVAPLGLPISVRLKLALGTGFLRSRLSSARARPSSSPTPTPRAATTPTPSRTSLATTSRPSPPA